VYRRPVDAICVRMVGITVDAVEGKVGVATVVGAFEFGGSGTANCLFVVGAWTWRTPNLRQLITLVLVALLGLGLSWLVGIDGARQQGVPVAFICALLAFAINWLAAIPAITFRTETFFDLTGALTYLSVVACALVLSAPAGVRELSIAAMVTVWAVRLGGMLFIRIRRAGEDKRFREIKIEPVTFFSFWNVQALWVVVTSACAVTVLTSPVREPVDIFFVAGATIWATGFLIEVVADAQKNAFRARSENAGRFITTGLWAWSQHPNYLGEIVLWTGIAVAALPVLQGWSWLALISPAFVALLVLRISGIPTLDRQARERWGDDPEYQDYVRRTSKLFLLPPGRRA
jgi:steroid 5-alpha reductase family enzyme